MYGEFLKWHISQLVALIEALFVASPLGFGRLHDDIIFLPWAVLPEVIKEIATANQHVPTIVVVIFAQILADILH